MYGVELVVEAGFPTIEASSGDEALQILESRSDVGVVFTDVEMPPAKMTGVRLAEIVHARWPNIRLVVTSGRATLKDGDLPDKSIGYSRRQRGLDQSELHSQRVRLRPALSEAEADALGEPRQTVLQIRSVEAKDRGRAKEWTDAS
jgi:CheY-like chemotaxis protein